MCYLFHHHHHYYYYYYYYYYYLSRILQTMVLIKPAIYRRV